MTKRLDWDRVQWSGDFTEQVPRLISGLGVLLGLVLAVEGVLVIRGWVTPGGYNNGVASSLLFIAGLWLGAHWIATSSISPALYSRIARWCLASLGSFTIFIVGLSVTGDPLPLLEVISTVRWAASVGGGIGLLIGAYDARARQRAFEVGLAHQRAADTRRERDRLDEFAGVVSHDLRNPLSVAKGRLALAAEECDSDHLDAIARAHDRMETLIEDVLTLARAGTGLGETTPVALSEIVEASWQQVRTESAQLVNETEQTIEADESRVQQLFENLFRNAVEHGGEGVTVTVGDLANGFYVEDDGPGIPVDEQERIFEAGYSTSGPGAGFGMIIVRQIADAHGWKVSVTEGLEGGARFEFTFDQ